jgi:hypothetical protein
MEASNEYSEYRANIEKETQKQLQQQQEQENIVKNGVYSVKLSNAWNIISSSAQSVGTSVYSVASTAYSAPGYLYNNSKRILFGAGSLAALYAFKDLIGAHTASMVPILFVGVFYSLSIINDSIFETFKLTPTFKKLHRHKIGLEKLKQIVDDPIKRAKMLENIRGKLSLDVVLKEIDKYGGGYKNKGRTHKMKFKKGKTQKMKMKGNKTQKMKGGVYLTSEQQKNLINIITVILKMLYGIINDEYQRMDQLIIGFRTILIENLGTNLPPNQLLESSNELLEPPNQLLESSNQLLESSNQLLEPPTQLLKSSNQLLEPPTQLLKSSNQLLEPPNNLLPPMPPSNILLPPTPP